MAEIAPFKAIRYKYNKGILARVAAPPYDVISPAQQTRYYRKHPYNVIRLILGKSFSRDTRKRNKYQRAVSFLNSWLKRGILIQDSQAAVYFLQERYKIDGSPKTRWGFIALLRLEPDKSGKILVHEHTLQKPKEDRARLLEATRANFSPLFGLYPGRDSALEKLFVEVAGSTAPTASYRDEEGVEREMWKVTDKDIIQEIIKEMRPRKIFIADGHHRYEVNWWFSQTQPAHKFVMMYFANVNNSGLTILPIHRIIRLKVMGIEDLERKISEFFFIEKVASRPEMFSWLKENSERHCFGMYYRGGYYLLQLNRAEPKRSLAGEIFNRFILKKVLKLDANDPNLSYTVDNQATGSLVFFLNPIKVEKAIKFSLAHKIMPPKSTYFYPKLPSGLVIYRDF